MDINKDLTYVRFNPKTHRHLLSGLVDCYRKVFAGAPWNEWKKCGVCKKEWGEDSATELVAMGFLHCGEIVADSWPAAKVEYDLSLQLKARTSCWIAVIRDWVIGFAWGYPICPAKLADDLKSPDLVLNLEQMFGPHVEVAYQDDLGVLPEFRGNGISRQLIARRLKDLKDQGLKVGVARVKRDPPSKTYDMYIRDGFSVVSEYEDGDGRVILARVYEGYDGKHHD